MKYFSADLLVKDKKKNNLLIENACIPFKKKKSKPNNLLYEKCFIYNKNIDFILENENSIMTINHSSDIKEDVYFIYSDGGSFNNGYKDKNQPMFGSTATFIVKNNKEEIFSHYEANEDVTNNECELTASLIGLRHIAENIESDYPIPIILVSDSQYLIKGINEWMDGWIKRGWKNNEGEPTKNLEIWKEIKEFLDDERFDIYTCWVRGHQTENDSLLVEYNTKCDYYCNLAINDILVENNLPPRPLKNIL